MIYTILEYSPNHKAHRCESEDGQRLYIDLTVNDELAFDDNNYDKFANEVVGKKVEVNTLQHYVAIGVGIKIIEEKTVNDCFCNEGGICHPCFDEKCDQIKDLEKENAELKRLQEISENHERQVRNQPLISLSEHQRVCKENAELREIKFTKDELQIIDDVVHDALHEYRASNFNDKYEREIELFKSIAKKINKMT